MLEQTRIEKNRLLFPLIVLSAWTAFGLFFGTQNYVRDVYVGKQASLPGYLASWLICGYSWALLTVPVLKFVRRFSVERLGWSAFFLIHIPAATVFSGVALGVYVAISTALFGARGGSIWEFYKFVFVREFQSEILVYFLIAGVPTAYDRLFSEPTGQSTKTERIVSDTVETNGQFTNGNDHGYLKRLSIKDRGRIAFVETDAITWIGSYGNYLKIHTAKARYVHRETMNAIEQRLNPQKFVRIRRSAIIRVTSCKNCDRSRTGNLKSCSKTGPR